MTCNGTLSLCRLQALPEVIPPLILPLFPHRPQPLVIDRCDVSGGNGVHLELSSS
jgi:hypothetical protein